MQDSSDKQPIIITLGGLLGLLVAALAGAEALPYRPVWQGLLLLGALILTTGLGRAWERHRLRGQATLSQDERLLSESQMIAGIQNWIADLETGTITIGPGNHPILG
ncbi:MAG: hypothetical protein HGA65_02360, partial [Oscillochloris sp.]|nr:hypothetical protein [Oscillochloris sp.]